MSFRFQSLPNLGPGRGSSDAFQNHNHDSDIEFPGGTPVGPNPIPGLLPEVPEPSTYALGGLLVAALAIVVRKLRRG
ncbi:MAG: PEP-CTERM sorting domain-containing protein [Puniceicoccaceae bacterium]|nr:MAG: PEP-CTERM sorting domain-containing protein [Puniceicoccaceae bacterium]